MNGDLGHEYGLFGLRFRSEVAIPELRGCAPDPASPVVLIRRLRLPATSEGGRALGGRAILTKGEAMLVVPSVARFRVTGGHEIAVDIDEGASQATVNYHLLGLVMGVLFLQRGLVPVHASAIVVDGACVAFVGTRGAGKSTLAAHLHRCGYMLACDDACVVDLGRHGRPIVWLGLPRLKLRHDALAALGHSVADARSIDDVEKYYLETRVGERAKPLPLGRIYDIGAGDGEPVRLAGPAAFRCLFRHSHGRSLLRGMELVESHAEKCAMILSHAPVFATRLRRGFDCLDEEADRIQRHIRAARLELA